MKLVGLQELETQMKLMKQQGDMYRKGGAKNPHLLVNLTEHNGQSYVANYIANTLYDNKLRQFRGLDIMLEYRLDGSLRQLKQIYQDIQGNAVYTNAYEGVVVIDISALSDHVNEYQSEFFVEMISKVSQSATVVIYHDEARGRGMHIVKERVARVLNPCLDIYVEAYSNQEFSQIVIQNIMARGIVIDSEAKMEKQICKILDKCNVNNAKQSVALVDDLMICADYSEFTPKIETEKVKEFWDKEKMNFMRRG